MTERGLLLVKSSAISLFELLASRSRCKSSTRASSIDRQESNSVADIVSSVVRPFCRRRKHRRLTCEYSRCNLQPLSDCIPKQFAMAPNHLKRGARARRRVPAYPQPITERLLTACEFDLIEAFGVREMTKHPQSRTNARFFSDEHLRFSGFDRAYKLAGLTPVGSSLKSRSGVWYSCHPTSQQCLCLERVPLTELTKSHTTVINTGQELTAVHATRRRISVESCENVLPLISTFDLRRLSKSQL